ncbi:P-loop containing nucleoside triphosphate hydrolase protein [Podospora fimiseda]|uniref:P-loop containing nucleoside triphosphate hydrolase protein n=1 Tax=Podospora fimiseda TaxID=252190 RepID=A0AAN7BPN0_9PEZI|nr:P-loop containing nucleoside triphosphate hydrolase protein [Podospora fimiseda]
MSNEGVILVLGVTGAGKSYFINQLKTRGPVTVAEGHSLTSETERCQAVQLVLDDDDDDDFEDYDDDDKGYGGYDDGPRKITIVDTPGFDDTHRPDAEVFAEISEYMAIQHASGVPLKGVLYLHRITDIRMTGSAGTYLKILQQLIGEEALKNTILVTTMWNLLRDEAQRTGLNRQQELIDEFWRPLINKGAWVASFDGSPASAFQIVSQVASKQPVVLDHQREMMEEERNLEATSAGRSLLQQLESTRIQYSLKLVRLEKEMESQIGSGDKATARVKEKEIAEVTDILKRLDRSLEKLNTRPGPRIKEKISRLMSGENAARAVNVVSAVLNLTLFVVRVVVGV